MDLERLELEDVSFNGSSLPTTLNSLPNLWYVWLKNCDFAGGLDNLFVRNDATLNVFPSITLLIIDDNPRIGGTMPSSIGLLTMLEELSLKNLGMTGYIPPEMDILKRNLRELYLHENKFNSTLSVFQNFSNLEKLNLNDCSFMGDLDELFGSTDTAGGFSKLRYLFIESNSMSGTIPCEIGNLTSLEELWLGGNFWMGTIPTEFGMLSSLKYFYLENCALSGTIPTKIGQMTSLYNIWLNGNDLTGTIPTELGLLSNLENLRLTFNFLNGTIPVRLSKLERLQNFMLEENDLTGFMPDKICQLWPKLSFLSADCKANDPEVICNAATCCTCCESPC
ncbi:hypothetical protein ACA910_019740 [Epithemia clementina (nom. ined.)]